MKNNDDDNRPGFEPQLPCNVDGKMKKTVLSFGNGRNHSFLASCSLDGSNHILSTTPVHQLP